MDLMCVGCKQSVDTTTMATKDDVSAMSDYLKNIHLDASTFPDQMYGWPISKSPYIKDKPAQIKAMREMEMRGDDVIIAAYPKCGTHWMWEVVKMLQKGTADIEARTKEAVMLEFVDVDRIADMDAEPSPRTLNSHWPFCHLPQQILDKKVKILHLVRNPKDCLVSLWYHTKSFPEGKDFTLEDELNKYLTNTMKSPNQLYYERQMQAWRRAHPDHPVKTVFYEDMKRKPLEMTIGIAKFLGLDVSSQFCQEVVDACSFQNMKSKDQDRQLPSFITELGRNTKFEPYRKGIIGDWKNNLTVAQNEAMDAYIEKETKGLDIVEFLTYE